MEPQVVAALHRTEGRLPLEAYFAHGARVGITWTDLRKLVFRLIWADAGPLGVYEAAARLSKRGRVIHPTSVYRCLRCFEQGGLVLPIVTWNRFLLSPNPAITWWGLLLCRSCRSCTPFELTDEREALEGGMRARGFTPDRYSIECEGRCRTCQEREE